MFAVRADGGGRHPEVEDEFACAGMLRGSLASLHGTVERIFAVAFRIGTDDLPHGNSGQIWLKLGGPSDNVKAAKLFVKGIVNQEEQQEVSYPGALHCVFCGARGLFLDCLIRSTSAQIVLGPPGSLLISGLAEPVVRAYSLITELLERYESSTRPGRSEAAVGSAVQSPELHWGFKALVDQWEVRRAQDLQDLPGSVKEILLNLVKESGPEQERDGRLREASGDEDPEPHRFVGGVGPAYFSADVRRRAEAAEGRTSHFPQEVGEEELPQRMETQVEDDQERQLSMGNKEFWLLLKFFTAMGYTEDVVKRVLARTGPKEASQILDLVQQEQDRSDQTLTAQGSDQDARTQPCEMEDREVREAPASAEEAGVETPAGREEEEEGKEEDFVLGVIKKAAASCGYAEQNVAKLYNLWPDMSTHQLLVELQKEEAQRADASSGDARERDSMEAPRETFTQGPREMDIFREGPRETFKRGSKEMEALSEDVGPRDSMGAPRETFTQGPREMDIFREGPRDRDSAESPAETSPKGSREMDNLGTGPNETETFRVGPREGPRETDDVVPDREGTKAGLAAKKEKQGSDNGWAEVNMADLTAFQWIREPRQPNARPQQPTVPIAEVKGPPMPTYPPSAHPQTLWPNTTDHSLDRGAQVPVFPEDHPSPPQAAPSRRRPASASTAVVTGEQRFLEGLQTPFRLRLADRPGDGRLRTVIIDGSNVAMSHGLSHFFSCRGIALAVQHFWDRGHRQISVLVPQWRQKSDPRIKEQHYLLELQELGLLSYTPSREVLGKRISSYDDRFMLQLAQKTDGVIVTNDNLRDMLDESTKWRDIIKKRLLQYTFVGDHFMVPDDPLGKGGPHLDQFLRSEHRTPDPGNHSFAGLASSFPSPKAPRSQTEVLNFRDRTPGGAAGGPAGRGGGRAARGRGPGKRREAAGHQHRQPAPAADRSPEETARLREQLDQVFPAQDHTVTLVLQLHAAETDVNVLSELILQRMD